MHLSSDRVRPSVLKEYQKLHCRFTGELFSASSLSVVVTTSQPQLLQHSRRMAKRDEHVREQYKMLTSQWYYPSSQGSNTIGRALELVLRGESPATHIKIITCQ